MAARIRLLAWIYVVTCGVSLGVGVVVCIGLLVSRDAESGNALLFVGPVFGALAVLFFLPGFLGGLGLLRAKPWARTIIIVLSFLIILAFPVGTALGGFGLWVLRTQDGGQSRPSSRTARSAEGVVPTGSTPMPPASMPAIEPNADAIPWLHDRIGELARVIDAPAHVLPTFGYSEETGRAHVEVRDGRFHHVVVERGREYERFSTTSVDDLLYRLFRDATFSMAATQLAVTRVTWRTRRQILQRQLELLGRLDPRWAARRKSER